MDNDQLQGRCRLSLLFCSGLKIVSSIPAIGHEKFLDSFVVYMRLTPAPGRSSKLRGVKNNTSSFQAGC